MKANVTALPRQACEEILRSEISRNLEANILPSEIRVAERMLARGAELEDAYADLHAKLHARPPALQSFLVMLLQVAAHWGPEQIARARADRKRLVDVNARIEKHARALASLLDERTDLHNRSGFTSGTLYHVADMIERATANEPLFRWHLQDKLAALRGQYDLKYWPSLGACMRALSDDASGATAEPTDELIGVATASSRHTKTDFVFALLQDLEEYRGEHPGCIPRDFQPLDETWASLVNVLLELPAAELVDGAYIKGRRHALAELRSRQE